MTRRELINALLNGDMNEEIFVIIEDEEGYQNCYSINYTDADCLILKGRIALIGKG